MVAVALISGPVAAQQDAGTPPIPDPLPPAHAGRFHHVFLEKAEFSSSLPNWEPPTITIVAKEHNMTGLLTDVRWTAHKSMGSFGTYISLTMDGQTHVFPLAYGHETQRNVGAVYADSGVYRLPLGAGLRVRNSFEVRVYGIPFQHGLSGGGGVYNILIAWRQD